ncbi:MAG: YbaN family protein [Pseudomonadota bacterium]
MRLVWMIGGTISLTLGVIGLVLPLLPTTPFIILAAYCYARSSKRMHDWLLEHKVFGPLIDDWRRYGAIRRPAKIMATLSVIVVLLISLAFRVSFTILTIQTIALLGVLVFIWTRPNGDAGQSRT